MFLSVRNIRVIIFHMEKEFEFALVSNASEPSGYCIHGALYNRSSRLVRAGPEKQFSPVSVPCFTMGI